MSKLKLGNPNAYDRHSNAANITIDAVFESLQVGSINLRLLGKDYKISIAELLYKTKNLSERDDNEIINIIDRIPAHLTTLLEAEMNYKILKKKFKIDFDKWMAEEKTRYRNSQMDHKSADTKILSSLLADSTFAEQYQGKLNLMDNLDGDIEKLSGNRDILKIRLESLRSVLSQRREVKSRSLGATI